MTTSTCGCGRPSRDSSICPACESALRQALSTAVGLAGELDVTLSRKARLSDQPSARTAPGAEMPLPFNLRASDVGAHLRSVLASWVTALAGDDRDDLPGAGTVPLCRWLQAHMGDVRRHEFAFELVEEITRAARDVVYTIDRPPERRLAGQCGYCRKPLYALPSQQTVECRDHDPPWVADVDDQRARMIEQAADILAHAAGAVKIVTTLGLACTPVQVSRWADRGRLLPCGWDERARPTFRVGDVVDLAAEAMTHQAARRATRRTPTAAA